MLPESSVCCWDAQSPARGSKSLGRARRQEPASETCAATPTGMSETKGAGCAACTGVRKLFAFTKVKRPTTIKAVEAIATQMGVCAQTEGAGCSGGTLVP